MSRVSLVTNARILRIYLRIKWLQHILSKLSLEKETVISCSRDRRCMIRDAFYYAALLPKRGPHIASHSTLSVRLSVCLSVCLSVPLSLPSVTSRHLANYNDTHVLYGTRWGPHIVRPSRPHKFLFYRATLSMTAVLAVVVCLSVCLYVPHTRVLYRNGYRYHQTFSRPDNPITHFPRSTYSYEILTEGGLQYRWTWSEWVGFILLT